MSAISSSLPGGVSLAAGFAPKKHFLEAFNRSSTGGLLKNLVAGAIFLAFMVGSAGVSHAEPRTVVPTAPSVQGTEKPLVQAVLTQAKVLRSKDGKESLEDASKVKPGDIIEYKVTYTNNGNKPVSGLEATLPLADGLEYQPKSAKPASSNVQAAAANGAFAAEPLTRRVGEKLEALPYSEYRQLRWTLGNLPAHATTTVSARAQVIKVLPIVPKPAGETGLQAAGKPESLPQAR